MNKPTSDKKDNNKTDKNLPIENQLFYFENGLMVMKEQYHLNRGYCCGSKCRHCPYEEE